MDIFLSFIVALVVGVVAGYAWAWRHGLVPVARHSNGGEENKAKLMKLFAHTHEVKNHDVQKLLKVSDSTAERYLEALEQDGKIIQHGTVGTGVFYTRV